MRPLEGVKVIDLSTWLAASSACRILADQGAEVIKVEPIEGDPFRKNGFLLTCPIDDDENPIFDIDNSNKKFLSINLKEAEGVEILGSLIKDADILITNYRQDALERLNLTYEELSVKKPELIYGHLTGYGEKGPEADSPGYDTVAFYARSGLWLDNVVEGGQPVMNISGSGDHIGGMALAQGVLAAYIKQLKTGRGDKVSTSLYHAAIYCAGPIMVSTQYRNVYPKPYNKPALSPIVGTPFRTADNRWVVLMILDYARYFKPFCASIGREDLLEEFDNPMKVKMGQEKFIEIVSEIIQSQPYQVWAEKWSAEDISFDLLKHMKEVHEDEQAIVNNYIRKINYPSGEKYVATTPVQFKEADDFEIIQSRGIGANTREILQSCGMDNERIDSLIEKKVVKGEKELRV